MSGFDVFKFRFWTSVGTVVDLIDSWEPTGCQTEKDYENSLYEHLRAALRGIVITPQYAFGRARVDLAIENKVAIEIKKNLNDTSEFQRLLGQILQFEDWKGYFITVLVGSMDPNLLDELRKRASDMPSPFIIEPKLVIVEKPA